MFHPKQILIKIFTNNQDNESQSEYQVHFYYEQIINVKELKIYQNTLLIKIFLQKFKTYIKRVKNLFSKSLLISINFLNNLF